MKQLLLIALLICSGLARADFYIEPYAGYIANSYDVKLSGTAGGFAFTVDDSDNDSDPAFGGKLGYTVPLVAFGADYMKAGDVTDLGPFVEFRLPLFLKLRGTYIMSSTTKEEEEGFKFKGSGFKAGLAFSLLSILSINIDYITTTYDELDGTISGFDIDEAEVKRSAVMASIGFPFEI